jgi:TolB-like protein/Tfp pilus assembly protein PilF
VLIYFLFNGLLTGKIHSEPRSTADKSILVLPFKNFTGNPANQYFADGLTEEVLNSLYMIGDLRVISRTTSDHFRETDLTASGIAAEVNTRHVLEGSIRQEGDKIRISIQLIDGYRDIHIWSENFDRDLNNILGTQGEIAIQVAKILDGVIHENEEKRITRIPTRNHEAYDNYLKGRFLLHQSTNEQRSDINREGLSSALQYFEKAVEADTSFVEAYAGLAYTWFNISAWGYLPAKEGFPKAREMCRFALQRDPDCAEAHAVMGAYYIWGERKFEEGRKELLTALRLNPNYTSTSQWYAQLLMITGPLEEARRHMDRTLALEPYFWVNHNLNAWIYYFEEEYDKAIEACRNAYDLNKDFPENNWLFFLNYVKLGEGDKALEKLLQITQSGYDTDPFEKDIKIAYENEGIHGLFKWLIDTNLNNPVPSEGLNGHPFFLAWWYAIIGDSEMSMRRRIWKPKTNCISTST